MNAYKPLWALSFFCALVACNSTHFTTHDRAFDLNDMEVHRVRQIFGAHCVLKQVRGSRTIAHASHAQEVTVYTIKTQNTAPEAGWYVADIAYRGHRDNLYFNPQNTTYLCGSELWRAYRDGLRSHPLLTTPILTNSTFR
jgi:hypothetical protein